MEYSNYITKEVQNALLDAKSKDSSLADVPYPFTVMDIIGNSDSDYPIKGVSDDSVDVLQDFLFFSDHDNSINQVLFSEFWVGLVPIDSDNSVEEEKDTMKEKELIVYTVSGNTYHFKHVTDFLPTTTGFSFTYTGVATGVTRQSNFDYKSTAGYSLADMD